MGSGQWGECKILNAKCKVQNGGGGASGDSWRAGRRQPPDGLDREKNPISARRRGITELLPKSVKTEWEKGEFSVKSRAAKPRLAPLSPQKGGEGSETFAARITAYCLLLTPPLQTRSLAPTAARPKN